MLTEVESMEISILRKQGKSLREISKYTGRSINTVRKYASDEIIPKYKKRPGCTRKLDPYKKYIYSRLTMASPYWIPATVIYREIKEKGYPGKIRQLRYFMETLKPKIVEEPLIRFETKPGKQAQVDWAHFKYKATKLYAFIATLGYSRMSYVEFAEDMQIASLINCHENAFNYFGGVSHDVLYDNMKTVVIKHNAYGAGQHKLHPQLRDFAKHYGFMPRLCKPYKPETKGKVERFIRYLRASFFIPLIATLRAANLDLDCDTANAEVLKWLNEVANQRQHQTINDRPINRMETEQEALLPLPPYYNNTVIALQEAAPIHIPTLEVTQHDLSIYDAVGGCYAA